MAFALLPNLARRSFHGSGICPGGFSGIEEREFDQRDIRLCDPDEHQLSGRIVGAKLWRRRYPFAPIRFRRPGCLALLEADDCAFDHGRK